MPAGFAVTQGTCSAGIAPGASCQLSVTFTPTASQNYSGTISATVTSSGGGTSTQLSIDVTGTVASPQPVVSVTSLAFANTNVGSTSAGQTFTLSNTGTGALTISSISIAGANPADFAQTNTCGASLAVGATCNITVTFTPASAATFNATVNIADNATGSPQTVALSGTGIGLVPQAVFSPASLSFPSTAVGSSSAAQTITLSNPGNAALTISNLLISSENLPAFTQTNTCGSSVAAGASCTFSVTFTPASATTFNASIRLSDNATGSPQSVPLSGTGTPAPAPQAVLAPTSITFPSTTIGSSSSQTTTLSNTGNAVLNINSISVTGASQSSFTETTTCGSTLAAGDSCAIKITFTPLSTGSVGAAISVADNAANSPQTVALSGTGVATPAPQAVLSPTSLTFASTTVGSTSAAQTLTLSNPGNATLSLSGVSLTGANPADYAETTTCVTSLAAGASCTISVTFTPASAASFNATISVADNASGSPQTAALSGTGAAPADFTTSASTSTQTVTAGGAAQFVIAVQPQGGTYSGTVTFSAVGLPAGATASFQPASISPGSAGATTTLTIQTAARQRASLLPARWTILPQGVALTLVAPLCLWRFRRGNRSRDHRFLLGAFVLTLLTTGVTALTGCGGGLVLPSTSAPATYSITVTGTSGSTTHSTTVSLIVK